MNTAAATKRQASEQSTSTAIVVISWILRLVTAVILLQTLYFKFTGAP